MDHEPHNNENDLPPRNTPEAEVSGSSTEQGVLRKLRYDAPTLDVPRPNYLRPQKPDSDEDAA